MLQSSFYFFVCVFGFCLSVVLFNITAEAPHAACSVICFKARRLDTFKDLKMNCCVLVLL